MIDMKEIVAETRSYRSFDPSCTVSRDELLEMIDCARMSASAGNKQPLRYRICLDESEKKLMLENTRLAALLPDIKLPPEGHEAAAYIVICRDGAVCPSDAGCAVDTGIAAQTIMLTATTFGLGGCMVANFDRDAVSGGLSLPETMKPLLVLLIGKPDETCIPCLPSADGNTSYFRDSKGVHFVPKRKLEDVLI